MSVLFLAAGIYLYLCFLGWGLTRIAVPRTLRQHRAYFVPWIGLMLAAVLGVRLSRLGMSAAAGIYWITGTAAAVGVLSLFPKFRSTRSRIVPRLTFMFSFLITLLLALYPLLCL